MAVGWRMLLVPESSSWVFGGGGYGSGIDSGGRCPRFAVVALARWQSVSVYNCEVHALSSEETGFRTLFSFTKSLQRTVMQVTD